RGWNETRARRPPAFLSAELSIDPPFVDFHRRQPELLDRKRRLVRPQDEVPGCRLATCIAQRVESTTNGGFALSPDQRRGRDLDRVLRLHIMDLEIAVVDAHGTVGIPRRRDLAAPQFELGVAIQELT